MKILGTARMLVAFVSWLNWHHRPRIPLIALGRDNLDIKLLGAGFVVPKLTKLIDITQILVSYVKLG